MPVINGKDVRLKLKESGTTAGYTIAGCDRAVTIDTATEMVEVTGISSYFIEFLPTYDSASIYFDSLLTITADGSEFASGVLLQWKQDHQLIDFQVIWSDGTNDSEMVGSCYITSASITGAVDSVAEMSLSLVVTGRYDFYS